ncbi:unnamed protein product [Absidia cylindrospora]
MDLSWCLSCDCHCVEDSLYCSDACRMKDNQSLFSSSSSLSSPESSPESSSLSAFPRPGTPTSPLLEPFFSSFHHSHDHHRHSIVIPSSSKSSTYSLFAPINDT